MWKVLNNLNRSAAAGTIRCSVREESIRSLTVTFQQYSSLGCSSDILHNYGPAVNSHPVPGVASVGQLSILNIGPNSAVTRDGPSGIYAANSATPADPVGTGVDPRLARVLPVVPPFLVFPESLTYNRQRGSPDNSRQVPMLTVEDTWDRHGKSNDEVGCWNFVELLHYSSLLTVGYSIVHRQDLGWREHVLPQASCPAVAVRNKIAILAQPEQDETLGPFSPRTYRSRDKLPHCITVTDESSEPSPAVKTTAAQTESCAPSDSKRSESAETNPVAAAAAPAPEGVEEVTAHDDQQQQAADGQQLAAAGQQQVLRLLRADQQQLPAKASLTAAEQFQLELETIRGIQMLETGEPKGICLLKRLCVRGSSVAAFYLGMAHEQGAAGLAANPARARRYYELAASRGNPEAKYNLAVFHQQGLGGLAASEAEAGRLVAEAAADGVVEARRALGLEDDLPRPSPGAFSSDIQLDDLFLVGQEVERYGRYLSTLLTSHSGGQLARART